MPNDVTAPSEDDLSKKAAARRREAYRGSLRISDVPSAQELGEYRDVDPRLFEIIVENWKSEPTHRRRLENRGQILGFILAAGALVAVGVISIVGSVWGAVALAASAALIYACGQVIPRAALARMPNVKAEADHAIEEDGAHPKQIDGTG
jgi:hypothetical protein